jgi:hypothetical protein
MGTCLYFGIRERKVKQYQGQISYKNASLTGFLITLYAAILFPVATYFFYPYGNENYVKDFLATTTIKLKEQKIPEKDIQSRLKEADAYLRQPTSIARAAFYNTLIFGVIFSLIFASILRRREQPKDQV